MFGMGSSVVVVLPKSSFRFEMWWLQHPDFGKVGEEIWMEQESGDRERLMFGKIKLGS